MQAQIISPNHTQKLQTTFEKVKNISNLSAEWKETDKNSKLGYINHVRKDNETGLTATRGEGVLNHSIVKVRAALSDNNSVLKINKKMKTAEILKTAQNYSILYTNVSPPIGDDRDSLMVQGFFEENGIVYFVGTAIIDESIKPEVKGKVRATHHYQMYKLTPVNQNSTQIVYMSCIDPSGSIPDFMKSKMNNSRGMDALQNFNEYLQTLN